MNIEIILKGGLPALQFRKTIMNCDKNKEAIQEIIARALDNNSEIIIPMRLQFFNKDLAKYKLKKLSLI
jgi:hypothetical protein